MGKKLYILTTWSFILLSSLLTNCDGCKNTKGNQTKTPPEEPITKGNQTNTPPEKPIRKGNQTNTPQEDELNNPQNITDEMINIAIVRFGVASRRWEFLAKKLEDLKNNVAGVNINEKNTTDNNRTALFGAVFLGGNLKITKALLDRGADKDVKDEFGNTPLHFAALYGHNEIAKLLINARADKDAEDKNGRTPLHAAAFYGHNEIAKLLIEAGAEVHAKNKDGKTPLELAKQKTVNGSHAEIIALLTSKVPNS